MNTVNENIKILTIKNAFEKDSKVFVRLNQDGKKLTGITSEVSHMIKNKKCPGAKELISLINDKLKCSCGGFYGSNGNFIITEIFSMEKLDDNVVERKRIINLPEIPNINNSVEYLKEVNEDIYNHITELLVMNDLTAPTKEMIETISMKYIELKEIADTNVYKGVKDLIKVVDELQEFSQLIYKCITSISNPELYIILSSIHFWALKTKESLIQAGNLKIS